MRKMNKHRIGNIERTGTQAYNQIVKFQQTESLYIYCRTYHGQSEPE